jgi:hypothetical protein
MTESLRQLLEHAPFVMMTTSGTLQPDWRSLFGAVLIAGVSVVGGGYIATKEMAVEVRVQARSIDALTQRFDQANLNLQARDERMLMEHRVLAERLVRVEEKQNGNQGMSGMSPQYPQSRNSNK